MCLCSNAKTNKSENFQWLKIECLEYIGNFALIFKIKTKPIDIHGSSLQLKKHKGYIVERICKWV